MENLFTAGLGMAPMESLAPLFVVLVTNFLPRLHGAGLCQSLPAPGWQEMEILFTSPHLEHSMQPGK